MYVGISNEKGAISIEICLPFILNERRGRLFISAFREGFGYVISSRNRKGSPLDWPGNCQYRP